ncbi:MAG: DUF456 domain-containing protein [Anaerolineae bacterium]|nr:DUF456 domain-containing protein [Anaerolineae bacterium]MCB0199990.1 DUF456 domain-containing protein [Anaerolineae bacterium]MCB0204333.1 DUF456 domain-containing protein [Anaerolineae bacterium]MCB0255470.1 DUF456 domain-containing protein [Anaerolineae bacterium]
MAGDILLYALAYLLIFFGLIGSVLPLLPGPFLILLGALLWAAVDGFQTVGWPTLVFLLMLTLLAWASDIFLTAAMTKRAGASWKAVVGAIVGGLLAGIFLGGWIPVIGTIIATVAGAVAGILAIEFLDKRDLRQAYQAGKAYIGGYLLSSIFEAALAVFMILIFVWQAFLAR